MGQLHLGHLAKGFALKETPTTIMRKQKKSLVQQKRVQRNAGPLREIAKRQKRRHTGPSSCAEPNDSETKGQSAMFSK